MLHYISRVNYLYIYNKKKHKHNTVYTNIQYKTYLNNPIIHKMLRILYYYYFFIIFQRHLFTY
jgi:hypothetical protein